MTGSLPPYEKEYLRGDGGRIPVLVGAATLEGSNDHGMAFVLDLSEQKRALEALRRSEAQLTEAKAELAHVTPGNDSGRTYRVESLTRSINRSPRSSTTPPPVCVGSIGIPPNLEEASAALRRIVRDGSRAGDVISRMRLLFKKTTTATEAVDINAAIEEVVLFTNGEAQRNRVRVHLDLAHELPPRAG